jgi:hypothetical protein
MAKVIKYTDAETGEIRQVDFVAGTMLATDKEGKVREIKIEENKDYAKELAIQASDMDRQYGLGQNGMRLMDLGTADVQQAAPLPNYASGYRNMEGVAEVVSPVVVSQKPSAKYYAWDVDDAFQALDNLATGPGGAVPEISPRLSNASYSTQSYAVGGFVPTEVQTAADSAINPMVNQVRRCQQALYLGREVRVFNTLMNASSYAAANKTDLTGVANSKWNGGSASDPVKNLHDLIEAAAMEPTGIVMGRSAYNAFQRNPAVQKFVASKIGAKPLSSVGQEWSALLDLPPIFVAKMKVKDKTSGLRRYIYQNDVLLFRSNPEAPMDGQEISSSYTFRWTGDSTSDGQMSGGWLIRTFFDQKRGPRGGMSVVVTHQDAEILTSALCGGLIIGALQ